MSSKVLANLKECRDYPFLYDQLTEEELEYGEFLISRHKEGLSRCKGRCVLCAYLSGDESVEKLVEYIREKISIAQMSRYVECPHCGRKVYLCGKGFNYLVCPCGQWFTRQGKELVLPGFRELSQEELQLTEGGSKYEYTE